MKALITTKYYTTATGSARIRANSIGEKLIVGFDYGARCPHFSAAQKLAEKMGIGAIEEVISSLKNGRAFVEKGGSR